MLVNESRLINAPVMSLHVGGRIGVTKRPIINPANLRVVAYEIVAFNTPVPLYLLTSDIREFGSLGIIVDDADEFVAAGDVIKLDEILKINFPLISMHVRDEDGKKLGKVSGYTVDTLNFEVQQLSVRRSLLKEFTDTGGLLVHRSQIIEINDSAIIVKAPKAKIAQPIMNTERGNFVNPFKTPQVDNSSTTSL
ncbi:hypothetical protein KI440_00675 [Candidatus Saccharibacteria bacterium TM7i]|nr:hypothetical protein KI440_00675 [Candidatus Saccharibacteria bacterium TM7i]